jgi:hypothetical protein
MKFTLLLITLLFSLGLQAQTTDTTAGQAPTAAVQAPTVTPPALLSSDEQFVNKLWGKELGQCYMTQNQYEDFEKKWARYRVLTRARYNLLARSYFADKIPKLNPIEIDMAFQYQALEPMTCPGLTDENRILAVQKALEDSLAVDNFKISDIKKLFELDELPKKLEDYLDLFNDPSYISMPYSLQDGYDQLFKLEWDRLNSKKEIEYSYKAPTLGVERKIKFTNQDLRTIDAIARTIWSDVSNCEKAGDGYLQMHARILEDRANACEKDPMENRKNCRPDPIGHKFTLLEQVIAAPAQFPAWKTSTLDIMEVVNSAGKKIGSNLKDLNGKEKVGFRKMIRGNSAFRKTLCPAVDDSFKPLTETSLANLKKAYLVALELYREPKSFAELWQWPKAVKGNLRFYSYGIGLDKGMPKNLHSIMNFSTTPATEIDFKKIATATCPAPYIYERR